MSFEKPTALEIILEEVIAFRLGKRFYGNYVNDLGLKGDEKLLEFGCGGGICTRFLAQILSKGGMVVALDTSDYWLKKVKKEMQDLTT
ncbi:MAG: hypothetical protein ACOZCL_03015 [Bacillota bacterium]